MNEEALFALALEKKNAAERQALLDQACAGNAQLRAAIEGLLKASADAGSFLEHPPLPLDATVISSAASRDTAGAAEWIARLSFLKPCDRPDRIGKLVSKAGEYEIIEVVGHGGMGAVLRAFDTKLSRVVAVKVMAPELAANPVAVRRFLREATTAAAVHHEHVVTIHAVDDSHQPPYLVMQFVEGQTLQDKIDHEGALELKHILRIGSQAAAGLAAAHKTGLIHRDVKPSNILLENGVERVKISDFGLARAADDVQMTQTGIISGTPQYMSPEQAKGEPIDATSDLFSLGSVLYTMCTGRPAFRADNPIAVLRRVCDDTPRPIYEINAEIPSWLEAIVNKLLAKDPAKRFQSAAEVADLLGQHLAHIQNPALAPLPAPVGPMEVEKTALSPLAAAYAGRSSPPRWLWGVGLFCGVVVMVVMVICLLYAARPMNGRLIATTLIGTMFLWFGSVAFWVFSSHLQRMRASRIDATGPSLPAAAQASWPAPPFWLWGTGLLFAVVVMFVSVLKVVFSVDTRAIAPAFVILMFSLMVALVVWALTTQWKRMRAGQMHEFHAKPPKFAGRGIFIEHPVLGCLAIFMLIASVSVATYMLTAAVFRKNTESPSTATASLPSSAPASARLAIAPFDEKTAKAYQDAWAKHLGVPVEFTNSIGMTLRLIPPGKGAARPNGLAESADPFFLGTTEVTVGQFRRFADETKYQTTAEKNQQGGVKVQSAKGSDRQAEYVWSHPAFAASNDHPVALVTWHDAAAFCEWLSKKEGRTYRLPTSDEWNWAARAGSASRFYFGDTAFDLDTHAWFLGNSQIHSHPVRLKLSNPWGLYDVYGNVWEISYDFERGGKAVDLTQAKDGPQAAERIYFWGGSFNGPPDAITVHGHGPSSIPYSHTGFRVAIVGDLKPRTGDIEKIQTSPPPVAPAQTRPEND